LVRVSATANANAKVRCPHCQQTFPLVHLLESAVPEVEVVEPQVVAPPEAQTQTQVPKQKRELYIDQTAETVKDAAGKFVVPSQLAKGARRRKSSRSGRSRSRSSSRNSETERSSHRGSDSRSRPSGNRSDHREKQRTDRVDQASHTAGSIANNSANDARPQRKPVGESFDHDQETHAQSRSSSSRSEPPLSSHRSTRHRDARAAEALQAMPNPAMDILKVIAGACLALPIAYLIVMWVFTLDPLGIGAGLGEKLPFMVPAAIRGEADPDEDPPGTTEPSFLEDDEDSLGFGVEGLNVGSEALKDLEF